MSFTNETQNYHLPQWVGSDKPTWLVDLNGAFSAIDTGMAATQAQSDATDLVVAGHTSAISGLQSTTSDQGSAITGLRADVDHNTGDISTINSLIGNGTPTTTDKTIIGAINELDADITARATGRKYILIGDSFGYGVVGGGSSQGTGWIAGFAQNMPAGSVFYLTYEEVQALTGVAGFCSSLTFEDILKEIYTNKITDASMITDIVVLGGSNDLGASPSATDMNDAIYSFITYAKNHFPNADIKIGLLMKKIHDATLFGLPDMYAQCEKYNVSFISDLFGLMILPQYYAADGTHITADGYSFYQRFINEAIISGKCHYRFEFTTTVSLDTATAFTADDGFSARIYHTEHLSKVSFYRTQSNKGWPVALQSIPSNNDTFNSAITLTTPVEFPYRYRHNTAVSVFLDKTIDNVPVSSHAQDGFFYNTDTSHFGLAIGSTSAASTGASRAVVQINPEQAIWCEY